MVDYPDMYDPSNAEAITEEGKRLIRELINDMREYTKRNNVNMVIATMDYMND